MSEINVDRRGVMTRGVEVGLLPMPPGLLLLGLPQAGEAGRGGGRGEMEIGVVTDGVRLRDMEVGMRGGDDGCVARRGKDSGRCMADVCGVG